MLYFTYKTFSFFTRESCFAFWGFMYCKGLYFFFFSFLFSFLFQGGGKHFFLVLRSDASSSQFYFVLSLVEKIDRRQSYKHCQTIKTTAQRTVTVALHYTRICYGAVARAHSYQTQVTRHNILIQDSLVQSFNDRWRTYFLFENSLFIFIITSTTEFFTDLISLH